MRKSRQEISEHVFEQIVDSFYVRAYFGVPQHGGNGHKLDTEFRLEFRVDFDKLARYLSDQCFGRVHLSPLKNAC